MKVPFRFLLVLLFFCDCETQSSVLHQVFCAFCDFVVNRFELQGKNQFIRTLLKFGA